MRTHLGILVFALFIAISGLARTKSEYYRQKPPTSEKKDADRPLASESSARRSSGEDELKARIRSIDNEKERRTVLLVYADWLEENNREDEAKAVRLSTLKRDASAKWAEELTKLTVDSKNKWVPVPHDLLNDEEANKKLKDIKRTPNEGAPRDKYATWLEKKGYQELAGIVRLQNGISDTRDESEKKQLEKTLTGLLAKTKGWIPESIKKD